MFVVATATTAIAVVFSVIVGVDFVVVATGTGSVGIHSSTPGNCRVVCVCASKLRNHKIIFALTMKGNWFCYVYGSLYVVNAINKAEVSTEKRSRRKRERGGRSEPNKTGRSK